MICTIRDVDCCAHTKSLLTQQFQSEAWDLICMYIIVHTYKVSLPTPVFLPIYLSPAPVSIFLSPIPVSLSLSPIPISLSPTPVSLSIFSLSRPCPLPLFLPLISPFLSLSHLCLSFSLSMVLFLPLSSYLSPTDVSFSYILLSPFLSRQSLSLSHAFPRKKENIKLYCNIKKENL